MKANNNEKNNGDINLVYSVPERVKSIITH